MAGFGPNLPPAVKAGIKAAGQPHIRQSAAAQHLGAPQKPPRAPQRAPKAQMRARPPAKIGSGQKAIGTLNPGDIHNIAVTQSRLARNAELAPLKAQAGEIQANEQGATQAYGKLVGAGNEQLGQISTNVGNSAKTAENAAAEQALNTPKAIETSGQSQASMTAGYMTPELRAELGAEAQQAGSSAGARASAAQNIAQEGSNLVEQIRAAASLKALGGQQNITGAFQKQAKANQIAQQAAIAKTGSRQAEIESKLGQQNFTDRATAQGLGLKLQTLNQKGAETASRVRATERGQNVGLQKNRENVAQRETASQRSAAQKEAASERSARIKAQITRSSKGTKTAAGKTATPDALNKLSAELGAAYQGFVEGRSGKEKLTPAEIRQNLTIGKEGKRGFPKAVNQVLITAAQELYYTHKVSKATRAEMGKLGMNIGYDNEAFHAVSGK